jgi:AmiR/NasT family two-component response regulator
MIEDKGVQDMLRPYGPHSYLGPFLLLNQAKLIRQVMPLRGKIIVAGALQTERKIISEILRRAGFAIAAETSDAANTLRRTRTLYPDLVIVDLGLDGSKGLKTAEIITQDGLAAVLLIVDSDVFPQASHYHYLIRPLNHNTLIPAVDAALYYWRREGDLRKRLKKLEETLDTRKLLDKAKGLLMDKMGMSENEAHRYIQKVAMNKAITLKQAATQILDEIQKKDY